MLLFLSNPQAFGQTSNAFVADSLDRYMQQALDKWQIPGAAVCIVKDGIVLAQKGYGVSNWSTKTKVDEKTVFPLASISKTFTGTLFATLEAEGKISINDPVKKWLPEFSMHDKLYEQQVTLADVLSHRSGWKTFQGDLLNTESNLTYPEMIRLFGKQTPAYPIRTRFGYSNFGFMIAGESVKNITGQSWNAYLQNRLLCPLGMSRTLVFEEGIKKETNKAVGHTLVNKALTVLPPDKIEPYSHGGMYASIQDLGTWMKVLLNKGYLNDKSVIPENAVTKMWLSNTIIGKSRAADREMYFKTYGLGWEIMQYQNVEVMQHNGAYSGALTSLALVPGLKLGIAVLTNGDNHLLHETLKWQVIDAFMHRKAPNYTLATIERQNQRKTENDKQKENQTAAENFTVSFDALVGTYVCDYYGKAFISKEKSEYVLTLEHHPSLKGVLSPHQKEKLTCTYNHPMFGKVQFPFVIEKNGVKSFTLFVDGFVEADGYEFKKAR
ncbi:serine hydrolase domain-containing protein [Hymenobacter sp. B81]|uniref:serine hydrolase domain-containing protein n=1 Tax=Hymenobacter sp. B81 TaxID=3344878 RepID=UPI0037DC6EDB